MTTISHVNTGRERHVAGLLDRLIQSDVGQSRAYRAMAGVVALVLLVAAALKADRPDAGLHPAWIGWAGLACETTVAGWLLSGLRPAVARWASIGLLTLFAIVSIGHLASGRTTCGCFGAVSVHPAWTAGFDALAVVSLTVTGRTATARQPGSWQRVRLAAAMTLVSVVVSLVTIGAIQRAGRPHTAVVLAESDIRTGLPFPLLGRFSPTDGRDMAAGQRIVVFYDDTCDHCTKYLSTFTAKGLRPPDELRVVDVSSRPIPDTRFRHLLVPPNTDVRVDVPFRVDLSDGTVTATLHPAG